MRYQYLLNNFKAEKAADAYYTDNSTFIDRTFNDDLEISQSDIEKLFTAFMKTPEVEKVAKLISKKLGRKLRPYDIWYNGFKNRSSVDERTLDRLTQQRYPNKEAFVNDLPNILGNTYHQRQYSLIRQIPFGFLLEEYGFQQL